MDGPRLSAASDGALSSRGFSGVLVTYSEAVQEGEQPIWRTAASRFGVARLGASECPFLDGHVGAEIAANGV
jgi:hypothetical protein